MGNLSTLDLSPVAISQDMDLAVNLADTTAMFSQKTLATLWPQPIQIVIIKKCPKLLRIYGKSIL